MKYFKAPGQGGYAALLTAAALLFLLGAAAMAVDTSMFFQQARSEQRVADLACLAGAQELPEDPVSAVKMAASFLRPNHPDLAGLNPNVTDALGPPVAGANVYSHRGFTITIETPFNGESTQMRVSVSQDTPTNFGRVIGATEVTINQEAFCEVGSALGGGADMPFGVLGGFTGGIVNYDNNDCTLNFDTNSECSGLAIPRKDDPVGSQFGVTTAKNYIANMVSGINWDLFPAGETFPSTRNVLCRTVGTPQPSDPQPCNRVATVSGSDPSKVYQGLISGYNQYPPESEIGYLEKHHLVFDHKGDRYDSHTLEQMATCVDGPNSTTVVSCPTPEDSLTWTGPNDVPAVVYVSEVFDCDCPRFARIPVVDAFPQSDCTISDPDDLTQVNKCSARISQFETVFLLRPYFNGEESPDGPGPSGSPANDFFSNGQQVKFIAAVRVVFTDDVKVNGDCFSDFKQGFPKAVRLVAG
ncbi:MAG: pilus assembly protein TadG-related protein [Acidimicrobiia bacterium]